MGVRDTLRKAAGFIVELPAEDNEDNQEREAEVPARPNESASHPIQFQQQPANDSAQAQTVAPLIQVSEETHTDEITALGATLLSAATG